MDIGSTVWRRVMSLFTSLSSFRVIGLSLAIMVLSSAQFANAQGTIGRVYKLQGSWHREGQSRPLTSNDAVPAGALIRNQSQSRLDFIVFLLTNGEVLEKRCSRGECGQTIQLPHSVKQKSLLWTIIEPVVGLVGRNPIKYTVLMPKSGTDKLEEAVVETNRGTADLAPVFGALLKGTYIVRLERKTDRGPAFRQVRDPVTFRWDPAEPSNILFSGLEPGIYEVRLLEKRANEAHFPTPVSAWVLVVKPKRFKQVTSSFREAQRMTAAWGPTLDEASVRGFLRAYLDHLSLQTNQTR